VVGVIGSGPRPGPPPSPPPGPRPGPPFLRPLGLPLLLMALEGLPRGVSVGNPLVDTGSCESGTSKEDC